MKNKLILVSIICIIGSTLGFINSSATTDRPTTSGPISSESKLPSTGPSGLPTNTPTPPLTYENYTYTVSNDTVTITGCDTSVSGTITIPSTINDYPVTTIGTSAFSDCINLTNIVIPDGVTTIGVSAFSGCTNLTGVNLSESITNIGDYAFFACTSITGITIPKNVTSIGHYAFSLCTSLSYINTANGLSSIGDNAFYSCWSLTNIIIPDSVTSIGEEAFSGCESLKNIIIPNSVTSIKYYTFYNCTKLKNITIPNSVTSIDQSAFYNCNALSNITIPNSVTSIGAYAFYGCSNLSKIVIPYSVTNIGDYAFYNCSSLASISISNSVTDIGYSAFANTAYTDNPDNWNNNLLYIDNHLIKANTSIETCSINNGTKTIAGCAFSDCKNLTSITIPNSITNIGYSILNNCPTIKTVYYKGTPEEWNEISVHSYNTNLTNATIVYVKCTQTAVSNDGKTFEIEGINLNIGDTVILALYNGNQFAEMQDAVYSGHDIPFTTNKAYTRAKVFVWDTLYSLEPITEVEIVKQ